MEDLAHMNKDTKITVRIGAVLRGKLVDEAGDYGNLSNVVRVILERYFMKRATR